MQNIVPHKKQKLSLAQKYTLFLSRGPRPPSELSNKYNVFEDLNIADRATLKEARRYIRAVSRISNTPREFKEKIVAKDRGRKAIKKHKQVEVKPGARNA